MKENNPMKKLKYRKIISKKMKGNKNGYIDGRTLKKYYCKCGKKICYITWRHGQRRCISCSQRGRKRPEFSKWMKENSPMKGKHHTIEAKKKISKKKRGKHTSPKTEFKKQHFVPKKVRTKISLSNGGTGVPYENTKYGTEFRHILKEFIHKQNNYTCQLCGKKESELKGYYKKLDVHHIDYNKMNCKKDNLISLCRKCNVKANFNRDYWYAYFTYIKHIKI